jgi:hypothetical protein
VPKQRLDLRAPDVQKMMPPEELEAAVNAHVKDDTAPGLCLPVKGEADRKAHQCGLVCTINGGDSKYTATAALAVVAVVMATEIVHPRVALSTCPSSTASPSQR